MRLRAKGTRIATATALAALAALVCVVAAPRTAGALRSGGNVAPRYDRTFKCDLVERLPGPPELVVFGGSRAKRFEPCVAERLTGLSAFNFAVQNSRPEDVYAMASWLFRRAPGVKLRCVWALQATTLSDSPLHPGLVAEERLTQFLPAGLVGDQRQAGETIPGREMHALDVYSARGLLMHGRYDVRLERGTPLATTLQTYLSAMVPKAGAPSPYTRTRAKRFFERTLRLFNRHGVEPALVIMPYHPTALTAFRAVGWGAREQAFKTYLKGLRSEYRFHLLDYTEIESFHGGPGAFYDGSHVKAANARRILRQAVKDAPGAFL